MEKAFLKNSYNPNSRHFPQKFRYLYFQISIDNMFLPVALQVLQFTRLIVDLSKEPNRYTQIAGISAGIPQINRVASEYVTHQENGYILKHLSDFEKGAYYYLGQLNNWNRSLIYSIEKIKENTGDRLVQKWENWLKEEQNDQG